MQAHRHVQAAAHEHYECMCTHSHTHTHSRAGPPSCVGNVPCTLPPCSPPLLLHLHSHTHTHTNTHTLTHTHTHPHMQVLLHPVWGSTVYPATVFTTAPFALALALTHTHTHTRTHTHILTCRSSFILCGEAPCTLPPCSPPPLLTHSCKL